MRASFSLAPVCVLAAALTSVLVACKKPDASRSDGPPAASALAAPSAAPGLGAWRYAIDPSSTTHVDMPGVKEHIQADTTAADGTLDVVPSDLARSRGRVRIDLATFSTHTFGNADDATQTKHARTWLEVQVGETVREDVRWADFAIRSIDAMSATDLSQVPLTTDASGPARHVTMTVHGDLLIHGHPVPKAAVVDVAFLYPSAAAGAPPGSNAMPERIRIATKDPVRVVLKEHDVKPRDPAGQILEWTARLVSKVAESADVTVSLSATPVR